MAPVPPVKGIGGPGKVPLYGAVPLDIVELLPVGVAVPLITVPVGEMAVLPLMVGNVRFCFGGSASE